MSEETLLKQCEPIIELLKANPAKQCKSVLAEAIELATKKSRTSGGAPRELSFLKDKNGKVVAILCSYFKRWMPTIGEDAVEFGIKVSSGTGFATACKDGGAKRTKQDREAKNATLKLMDDMQNGTLEGETLEDIKVEVAEKRAAIETDRAFVADTDLGFAEKVDVIDYLLENDVVLADGQVDADDEGVEPAEA